MINLCEGIDLFVVALSICKMGEGVRGYLVRWGVISRH